MFVWTVIREALYNYALELDSEILYDYNIFTYNYKISYNY